MNQVHLLQAQRAVERFFYKVRVNIALHTVLTSKKHSAFKKDVKSALEKQILYFAKVEKIQELIILNKVNANEHDIEAKLIKLFPLLLLLLKQDSFVSYLEFANNAGGQSAHNILNSDIAYTLPKGLEAKLIRHVTKVSQGIDRTTQRWIVGVIAKGVRTGATPIEIAKLLRDEARNVAEQRAEVIAEQEAAQALADAQALVYERAGVKFKRLITSRDERVCPICVTDEAAGVIPIDGVFPSGRKSTPIHILCRCFILPVLQTLNNG